MSSALKEINVNKQDVVTVQTFSATAVFNNGKRDIVILVDGGYVGKGDIPKEIVYAEITFFSDVKDHYITRQATNSRHSDFEEMVKTVYADNKQAIDNFIAWEG